MTEALESYVDHMRYCHEFKCSLNELMGWSGCMTHRQFVVWRKWLKDEWEKPNRTDRYIMRLIAIVDNMFSKDKLPEDTYMLKYDNNKQPQQKSTSTESPNVKRPLPSGKPRTVPIDPTGETIMVSPPPVIEESPKETEARIARSESIWLTQFMRSK